MSQLLPSRAPLFLVLNQASGSGDAHAAERVLRARLTELGRRFELHRVDDPRQLPALADRAADAAAREDGAVVVAGGDGTINAVTQAVLPRRVRLGVLPQGTFNFFGRCHGLPEGDVGEGVAALLGGHEKPVQVARVNGRAFLVNASLGLYPELLQQREQDKQRFGRHRWVALGSGLRTLVRRFPRLALSMDGDAPARRVAAMTLVVGNNRLQLEKIGVAPAAAVEHDQLVGMAVQPVGRARLVMMACRGLLGQLGEAEAMTAFAFRRLTVDLPRRRRIKVALDGEIQRMTLPLYFDVAPDPLRLIVPQPSEAPA